MNKLSIRLGCWLLFSTALSLTALIYWIGLRGGFVYDDYSFIVGNTGLEVTANNLQQWFAAALSFPSGAHQGRWLGMLSFGINHYFTGMDPFGFKLTNLGIHLLNGLLVFLTLRALFSFTMPAARPTLPTPSIPRWRPPALQPCGWYCRSTSLPCCTCRSGWNHCPTPSCFSACGCTCVLAPPKWQANARP